jgi:hypothetical protein
LAIISVDGINIVNGEKAGFDGPGYVILPGQTVNIPGWHRTDEEVAKFEFKPQDKSYSAQTGQGTSNTGVIGLAVYDEKAHPDLFATRGIPISATSSNSRGFGSTVTTETYTRRVTEDGPSIHDKINARAEAATLGGAIDDGTLGRVRYSAVVDEEDDGILGIMPAGAAHSADEDYGATLCSAAGAAMDSMELETERSTRRVTRSVTRRRRKETPELGTGYGKRASMYVTETTFERDSTKPIQVTTLQYAVRAKLIEWGVPLPEIAPSPAAFPAEAPGVAAPPGWRG